jgi:putative AdoMet-dependent methyltransferase
VDFSEKMLKQAKQKMPDATLITCDLKEGVPLVIQNMKFQYILSAYAFHHWEDKQKVDLIKQCTDLLMPNGKILIADIMFSESLDRESCKKKYRNSWDGEEFYILADEFIRTLRSIDLDVKFHPISFCCGILEISVR